MLDSVRTSVLGKFLKRLQDGRLGELAHGQHGATSDDGSLSAYLVWARVSREFLETYTTGAIRWHNSVSDNILGTSLVGTAYTTGTTRLVLKPSRGHALAELIFRGSIDSRTTGHNGPIVSFNSARTEIESHKPLILDTAGLHYASGNYRARTSSVTDGIETCLPRLRGRIATRIGWRQAEAMRPQVNTIAAQHAGERLERTINGQINRMSATLREALDSPLLRLPYVADGESPKLHFRTTRDYLDIIMYRADAKFDERQLKPPIIEANQSVAIRVHRVVVNLRLTIQRCERRSSR